MTTSEQGGLESQHNPFIPTREYVSKAVVELKKQQDAVTDQKITQAYKNLFVAMFNKHTSSTAKVMTHIETPDELIQIKETVSNILLQCTLSEPTRFLHRANGRIYENWGPVYDSTHNSTLNPTEVYVLINRFGLHNGEVKTYKQIGEEIGKSDTRIVQIEAMALRRIRNPILKKLSPRVIEVEQKHIA